MKSLAIQCLKQHSIEAARLWKQLNELSEDDKETIDELLKQIWTTQTEQEQAVDIMAEVAEQLDAEITAVKARMEHLITIHKTTLEKLTVKREIIDETIINLNQEGVISNELVGKTRRIKIKENPPTCEILVTPEQLPANYQRTETRINADKKAITAAWKKGIPVEGTRVYQKQKVVYS